MRCRRPGRALVLVLAAAALLAPPAGAQTTSGWPAFPLDELAPGTVGYALTEGPDGVERFAIEVVARQEGFGLGFPLVLVRASGPLIDAAGGVAAGMSGSPVVLPHDGSEALLGAIGYTFADAPGGLALVTPIEAMRTQGWPAVAAGGTAAPGAGTAGHAMEALRAAGIAPIATPVLVAGLGERALGLLQHELTSASFDTVQVLPGGGSGAEAGGPLVPGSAVAVGWVRGDVSVSAIGTLTELQGDRWLAFGHPLLGAGAVDWPLLAARVTALVPRRSVPFKLADAGAAVLGRLEQDRLAAVGGRLGERPDLLPVTLTVAATNAAGLEEQTTMRFEVVRDPDLWPGLVAVATLEALDRVRGRSGGGTATVHWDVGLRDGPGLRLSEAVVHATDVATAAARLTGAPLALLARNPFQDPRVTRVSLLMRIEDQRRDVEVRQVIAEAGEPVAGTVVPLYLRLQPWRRPGEVLGLDVAWPAHLDGRVELVVRGATWPREEGADEAPDPDDAPLTFDELLAFLRERPRGGDLVVEARADGGQWERLERVAIPGFVTGRVALTLDVAAAGGTASGAPPGAPDMPEDEGP
ncbi:MAG: hypothetical protein ACNA8N_00860 [Trueperaceae bacterium]